MAGGACNPRHARSCLALFVIAAVMLLFVGCDKRCTCKTYINGAVAVYHEGVPLDRNLYDRCSDMDSITSVDPKEGEECVHGW